MKTIIPTYEHSLIQVGNSIRKFCGLPQYHDSFKNLDAWIEEHHIQQLLVVLVDGMGSHQIHEFLDENGFLCANETEVIQSVLPPTTVAATTALRSGLYPSESGYLGWYQYMPHLDDSVVMFQNKSYYGTKVYPGVVLQQFPISYTVEDALKQEVSAIELFPWTRTGCDTFEGLCDQALKELHNGTTYVYAYCDEYDGHMHDHGVHTASSINILENIERQLEQLAARLPQHCGMVVLADHGHVDVEVCSLLDYPDLCALLKLPPALETRAVNFYIKEGKQAEFESLFTTYFADSFQLFSHEEVIQMGLFGEKGKEPKGEQAVGDFIACAIGDIILTYGEKENFKGHHAGIREEEVEIPLILYTKTDD